MVIFAMRVRARARRGGFSFVEMIVCVLVIGILAGVVAPKYHAAIGFTELRSAANQLASDIRHTQRVALRQASAQGLEFDTGVNEYRAIVGVNDAVADISRADEDLRVRFEAASLVRIQSADFGGVTDLSFNFRGEPAAAGSIVLTNGTRSATITVSETGLVSVAL